MLLNDSEAVRSIRFDTGRLTIEDIVDIAQGSARVVLSDAPAFLALIKRGSDFLDRLLREEGSIYGVTTGFGEFSNVCIDRNHLEQLQVNLIMSHAAGTGEPLPDEIVRAMMILRMNALAKGYSGVRMETLEFVKKVFNAEIIPLIPSRGSVGSSGDLAPLAHLVLTFLGKGNVVYKGKHVAAAKALRSIKLKPLHLTAKEGLALVNGTQMMTAFGGLAVHEARQLCKLADITASMSVEALKGSDTAFDARIHNVRPHRGHVRGEPRRLRDDRRVQRSEAEPALADHAADPAQQLQAARSRIRGVVARKVPTEITEIRGAEERVHDGV